MRIEANVKGTQDFLRRWRAALPQKRRSALREVGRIVEAKAKEFCPQSPTRSQSDAYTGPSKSRYRPGRAPGTLSNSIGIRLGRDYVDVGIFSGNALQYANKIHNRRHKDWEFLGPGSTAKGPKVGDKFLPRAVQHHARDIETIVTEAALPD